MATTAVFVITPTRRIDRVIIDSLDVRRGTKLTAWRNSILVCSSFSGFDKGEAEKSAEGSSLRRTVA